jgi:hypothetical protein
VAASVVRNSAFSAARRRTRASTTIRSPSNSALRQTSKAAAARSGSPSLIRRSSSEPRKFSSPTLKAKAASASNWFWFSGAKTASSTAAVTCIRS